MLRAKNQRKLVKLCRKDRKFFDAKRIKKKKGFKAFGMVFLLMLGTSAMSLYNHFSTQEDKGILRYIAPQLELDSEVEDSSSAVTESKESNAREGAFLSLSESYSWLGNVKKREIKSKAHAAAKLGGKYYEVSRKGEVLGEQISDNWGALPIVSGEWSVGSKSQEIENTNLKSGMSLVLNIEHSGLSSERLSEVYYDSQMGWIAYFQSPRVNVIFGKSNFFGKSQRLIKVFEKFEGRSELIKTIDLDFSEIAVVKFNKHIGEKNGQS